MALTLKRIIRSNRATLGILYDGDTELCRTLENPWKDNERVVSCIPTGTYACKAFTGEKYQNVWEVLDVEGRSAILIHNGNTEDHTKGCVLVGAKWGFLKDELAVLSSNPTLDKLRETLPEEFTITIIED